MDFKLWRATHDGKYCVIQDPELSGDVDLDAGEPCLQSITSPIPCKMDSTFENQIQLADNLYGASIPVVSERLKQVLEQAVTRRLEFLPVKLVNLKGRVEKKAYFILHPLDVVDCIDIEASKVAWNSIDTDRISGCQALILKPEAIPKDATLFRLRHWEDNMVVREDIIDILEKANLTGLFFRPPKEYWGIG